MRTAYFINIRNMRVSSPRRWFGFGKAREEEMRREMPEHEHGPRHGMHGWAPLLHEVVALGMGLASTGAIKNMLRNKNRLFQKKRKWWEWK